MGDIADMYFEEMIVEEAIIEIKREQAYKKADEIRKKYKAGTFEWITKDKRKILIQDMSNEHIVNTKRMIQRNMKSREDGLEPLRKELIRIFAEELNKRNPLNQGA